MMKFGTSPSELVWALVKILRKGVGKEFTGGKSLLALLNEQVRHKAGEKGEVKLFFHLQAS